MLVLLKEIECLIILWTVVEIECQILSIEIFEIIRAIHHHGLNNAKLLPTELESSSLAC